MALGIAAQFPAQSTAPDANNTFGSAQNITVTGDNTGTPWIKTLIDDMLGLGYKLLDNASLVPNGNPDNTTSSQYYDALTFRIQEYTGGRNEAATDSSLDLADSALQVVPFSTNVVIGGFTHTLTDGGTTLNLFTS